MPPASSAIAVPSLTKERERAIIRDAVRMMEKGRALEGTADAAIFFKLEGGR